MTGQMFGKLVSKDQQVVRTRFPIPAAAEKEIAPSAGPPAHSDVTDDRPRIHTGSR